VNGFASERQRSSVDTGPPADHGSEPTPLVPGADAEVFWMHEMNRMTVEPICVEVWA
jgi:hypothetical protein